MASSPLIAWGVVGPLAALEDWTGLKVLFYMASSVAATAAAVVVSLLGAAVAYYVVTLPLRRQERTRLFLALAETGLRQGRSVERTLVSLSSGGVAALGSSLHEVAWALEHGETLAHALERAPRFLPRTVAEMLRVGERVGDVGRVLPACRRGVADAQSRTRGAMSYLILIVFSFSFPALVLLPLVALYSLPRLLGLMEDLSLEVPPQLLLFTNPALYAVLLVVPLGLLTLAAFYAAGPSLTQALGVRELVARLAWRMPWRRKRFQRDFAAMLAVLLDAGVPEDEAVVMAGDSTGNSEVCARAVAAADALRQGVPLTEAVERLDDTGEFRWRLANAAHAGTGFAQALAGWQEALDAKAFQQEQAVAHVVTTIVVLANGAIVAVLAIGVFQCLLAALKEAEDAILW